MNKNTATIIHISPQIAEEMLADDRKVREKTGHKNRRVRRTHRRSAPAASRNRKRSHGAILCGHRAG
jgi:hypothetical protein